MDAQTCDGARAIGTLFENRDWTVTEEGLEHRGTRYLIERGQIGRRHADGSWAWAEHMLEKSWVTPDLFADAFRTAVRLFGFESDDALDLSFAGPVAVAAGAEVVDLRPVAVPRARRAGAERSVAARPAARTAQGAERVRRHG